MKLYSYPRCGTCRKALAWLRNQGLSVDPIDIIDITVQPPELEELGLALQQLGRRRLFNTSGQSYRALGAAAVQAMDDEQALAALAADGKLVKRPFLIHRDRVLTGFDPEEWQQLLLS
ncbi:arsenate reductase family protein [Cyanobium sp. CH-040]|uniref:arsenate reductase family protein n=1 Tax=Cyanobium sp. CH-040 TaxID=2823708 RepID=UPI0020CD3C15|nr:arsenate reductase family protein [Cyanobium sp. CH-040]MCP9928128.1 arsenate reductase family protein [Cyanobium sp. CH-040]